MKMIPRKNYLENLRILKDKNFIKVITGVRRCGKSTLMSQFQSLLRKENKDTAILSINFDKPEYRTLAEKDWNVVYTYIQKKIKKNQKNYIFLDEVQNVNEFEKLLEGLFTNDLIDLYVTGSNAYLLSSELATLLTGRAFEVHVLPFSFKEFVEFSDNQRNVDKLFADYIRTGGFPEAVNLAMDGQVFSYQYLQTVFANIYLNDISKRFTIYGTESYNEVVHFLIDSIGSHVSAGNIAKILTAEKRKIDNKTVDRYIDTMAQAFLFYKVTRFDIRGKQHLRTLEKYYLIDLGFRYALLGKELTSDAGHLLENIIYLELKRRNYQVWIGKIDRLEVDFVVRDNKGNSKYIQVAQTVQNADTLKRELAPFELIPDHHEKILITMDYDTGSFNGIQKVNAIDWLLNTE
jgi:predicted AAA+ superfamily ATPase